MKSYVYTNHRLKAPKPRGPVMVVQRGRRVRYTNEAGIYVDGKRIGRLKFSNRGLRAAPYHKVRAWVEFDSDVEVR